MRLQTGYWQRSRWRLLFGFAALLLIVWYSIGTVQRWLEFGDEDPYRHAHFAIEDSIDATPKDLRYLPQNWPAGESVWFYTASQGSNLLPYDFFLHLEQADNSDLFRDNKYLNGFRYLTQHVSKRNPDGLPVGIVRDTYKGRDYMGFSCSACHTAQLNYEGTAIRIDGAPAAADMESFMHALAQALQATLQQREKQSRFISAVLETSDYESAEEVLADLKRFNSIIRRYTAINKPISTDGHSATYGYARLDAFGRIYNRVLEHVLSADQLRQAMTEVLGQQRWEQIAPTVNPILDAEDQRWLLGRTLDALTASEKLVLSDEEYQALYSHLFNPASAPVSYPALWDTPQHDFVQWNGIVANAGVGPMGRNAGQVIGVFGNLEWQPASGYSWRTFLTNVYRMLSGVGVDKYEPDFTSSIHFRNLRRVEHQLRKLTSPRWIDAGLPEIDHEMAQRGQQHYARYCQSCHEVIDSRDPKRRLVGVMNAVDTVKTDAVAADNALSATGYAGILSNRYVPLDNGSWLIQDRAPVAALLKLATTNAVLGLAKEPDRAVARVAVERLYDFVYTINDNTVQSSLRRGDYKPSSTAEPFAELHAYKARALNGIWATAPYLHNGSVPTLYHLLLPSKNSYDSMDESNPCEFEAHRPQTFQVGSREFDAQQVGLRWQGYQGFEFNTKISGNGNGGHEYAAGKTAQMDGTVLPCLKRTQRAELLEYLKTL
jgi:cytochrome c5